MSPLGLIGLPCRDQTNDVRLAIRVDHDQERAGRIDTKSDTALLTLRVRIFPSQRKVVLKNRHGVSKTNAMILPIRFSFFGLPLVSHVPSVYTIVFPCKRRNCEI